MKSLLVFTENYARGGGNRYMIDMVNALASDYEQEFLASNTDGIFQEDLLRLNRTTFQYFVPIITRSRIRNYISNSHIIIRKIISLILIAFEPLFFLINIFIFVFLIRKLKPSTILSCNGGFPAAQACLALVIAGKLLRIPVVLSIVSMPSKRKLIMWVYEKFLDKLVWRAVSIIVVNANSISDALCKLRGAPIKKIRIVYNGIDDTKVSVPRNKIKNETFTIGCIARMDNEKGVLLLFDAFADLANKHPEMQLILAGHGDASAELARRTDTLGLQNQVKLLGHFDTDVSTLLETFDIYVFPSLWEGFPYSIIEALRSACVIVATRVGGIPEAIKDGVEGLLITPGSKDEIIFAIEKLMVDRQMRLTLSRNARLKFEHELTLPKMHMRVREVFSELRAFK